MSWEPEAISQSRALFSKQVAAGPPISCEVLGKCLQLSRSPLPHLLNPGVAQLRPAKFRHLTLTQAVERDWLVHSLAPLTQTAGSGRSRQEVGGPHLSLQNPEHSTSMTRTEWTFMAPLPCLVTLPMRCLV